MRKFDPLKEDHPLVGQPCAACHVRFVAGDETTLVALGPGGDPEAQKAAREGRPYNAVATAVHWLCSGGVDAN